MDPVAIFFASLTSRCVKGIASLRTCCAVDFASLRVADWVVLGRGTNVTRVTRGENIFNNKLYIGDLASIRCEVPGCEVPWRVPRGTRHNVLEAQRTAYNTNYCGEERLKVFTGRRLSRENSHLHTDIANTVIFAINYINFHARLIFVLIVFAL